MDIKGKTADRSASTTATAAISAATLPAAGAGKKYYITGIAAGQSGAAITIPLACTVTIGSLVKNYAVGVDPLSVQFLYPIPSETNGAPSISLAAGGAGIVGSVVIEGFIGDSAAND